MAEIMPFPLDAETIREIIKTGRYMGRPAPNFDDPQVLQAFIAASEARSAELRAVRVKVEAELEALTELLEHFAPRSSGGVTSHHAPPANEPTPGDVLSLHGGADPDGRDGGNGDRD